MAGLCPRSALAIHGFDAHAFPDVDARDGRGQEGKLLESEAV